MKLRLIKITPIGCDPEFMVVTEGSSAHTLVTEYAEDNAYPIKDIPCAHRYKCILQDLAMIERTIKKNAPFVLEMPALMDNDKPYNDHLWQSFSNIEVACDEESDEVEHEWLAPLVPELPTYEEYTKDMSLQKKLEMYYDADIDSPATSYKWTCKDIAEIVDNADWLPDFEKKFKEYLEEREYIKETTHGELVNKLMEIRKDWGIPDFEEWEPFTTDKKNIDEWRAHMNETLFNDYDIDYLKEVIEQEENEHKDTSIDEQTDTYIPHREGDE